MTNDLNNNGCVGCLHGKTIIVDPNKIQGQTPNDGFFVQPEDLSILVDLTTRKKSRSIITLEGNNLNVSPTDNNSNINTIRFFKGNQKNKDGTTSQTTRFTDLSTSLNSGENDYESLGITNIDIDFNSSYAPMVTINFVDVRGSALYQRPETSPYKVFFELPYPIFQLTVKGFYGQSVTYCLHLTKYNARFNSQSGNFEITANFIGYTYAMLSDVLIGYLRAITKTDIGKQIFEDIKKSRPLDEQINLITLDEFLQKVSKVNKSIKKLSEDDKQIVEIEKAKEVINTSSILKDAVIKVIEVLSEDKGIFITNVDNSVYLKPPVLPAINSEIGKFKEGINEKLKIYNDNITSLLIDLNSKAENTFQLTDADFKPKIYENILKKDLSPLNDSSESARQIKKNNNSENKENDYLDKVSSLLNVFNNKSIDENQPVYIYDFSQIFKKLNTNDKKINDYDEATKKEIAGKLRAIIDDKQQGLGIQPTIKNLVNILTTHVEVFLRAIYQVSMNASKSENRKSELTKLNKTNNGITTFDCKTSSEIYPFPEFRVAHSRNDGSNSQFYQEEWLGSKIDNYGNVPEVKFVEDLLKALIEVSKDDEKLTEALNSGGVENSWYPISPFDTKLFLNENPYSEIKNTNNYYDIYKVMLLRAMTYMGYSNKTLTDDEVKVMAKLEANNVNSILLNQKIKDVASQTDKTTILNFFKSSGHKETANYGGNSMVLEDFGSGYLSYRYIFNTGDRTYIPFNNFKGEFFYTTDKTPKPIGTLFYNNGGNDGINNYYIGNYTTNTLQKQNDGATYLKIISSSEFNNNQLTLPTITDKDGNSIIGEVGKDTNNGVITKELLHTTDFTKKELLNGRNLFGGKYGIQEFTTYKNAELEAQNFTLFYQNTENKLSTNLCNIRENENFFYNKNTKESFFRVQLNVETINSTIDERVNFGKNIEILTDSSKASLPYFNFTMSNINGNLRSFSLFGSRLYFEQTTDEAKALLFLHTFPWRGLFDWDDGSFTKDLYKNESKRTILNYSEIRNLFANNAAFIQAPKLWVAFIGGLLWRYNPLNPSTDSIVYSGGGEIYLPTHYQTYSTPTNAYYLTSIDAESGLQFNQEGKYKYVDEILTTLPDQARNEFIKTFNDFVKNEWQSIKGKLEISQDNWNSTDWKNSWNKFISGLALSNTQANTTYTQNNVKTKNYLKTIIDKNYFNGIGFKNMENYNIISPLQYLYDFNAIKEDDYNKPSAGNCKYNFFLELKDSTSIMSELIDLMSETVYIANGTYRLWDVLIPDIGSSYHPIKVQSTKLELYTETFINELKELNKINTVVKENDLAKQKMFDTMDNNTIKLNIYRTIKSIYDKWIGGSENENVIFQCGSKDTSLIDTFKFLDKAFNNIGNDFYINPLALSNIITENTNQSFYDLISRMLADNNFDFIALPSYINYTDCHQLSNMFKTYTFNESVSQGTIGPSFICMYVGQTSNKLDLGNDSYHENDSFDFDCNNLGQIPANFAGGSDRIVPVFAVNYGQQNQNIFKDIKLDQQEFTETEESLKITDSIAKAGSATNQTFVGQNLFNVYQVRAYKAEVEMMGNAMVQPMMYFQLNNIPMFHGAYLITKVKHSLEPNSMSTVFSGVRIRKIETKLVDSESLYMSMLGALTKSENNDTSIKLGSSNTTPISNYGNNDDISSYVSYEVKEENSGGGLKYQYNIKARYTIKENGEFMEKLATKWYNDNNFPDFENTLWLNDLSLLGGGQLDPHKTHQKGTSSDIKPISKESGKKNGKPVCIKTVLGANNYSQERTKKLIKTALDLSGKDGVIRQIYFNDKDLINYFNNYFGDGKAMVIKMGGHDNHLHFEFNIPKRVTDEITANKGKNNGNSEYNPDLKGTVVKVDKIPSISERLNHLGKV